MNKIKEYKEIIGIVVATIALFLWFGSAKTTAENNAKKISQQQTSIDLLTQLVSKHEGTLEGTLTMWGIDPDKAKKWAKMPKEPVFDTLGNPILGAEWLQTSNNLKVGLAYKFEKNDSGKVVEVFIDTLWNVDKGK